MPTDSVRAPTPGHAAITACRLGHSSLLASPQRPGDPGECALDKSEQLAHIYRDAVAASFVLLQRTSFFFEFSPYVEADFANRYPWWR